MRGTVTLAMLPKNTENAYFVSAHRGAEEAAAELGINLAWKGPRHDDPRHQLGLVEQWTAARVDVIAVSVADSDVLSPALGAARASGVKVVTWDADGTPASRELFVAPATPDGVGQALAAEVSRVLLGKGDFAVITASLHSPNQNAWLAEMDSRLPQLSPQVKRLALVPCNENDAEALDAAGRLLATHPGLGAILALCAPALLPAVEAVHRAGRKDVKVIGTGAPNGLRDLIEDGRIASVVGWSPADLGYLTVHVGAAVAGAAIAPEDGMFAAGRLGRVFVRDGQVRLGRPHVYSCANLDRIPS